MSATSLFSAVTIAMLIKLTLVLLNPDKSCLCKQWNWSGSAVETDLDLHCLPLSMWIYSNNPDQVIWLAEN